MRIWILPYLRSDWIGVHGVWLAQELMGASLLYFVCFGSDWFTLLMNTEMENGCNDWDERYTLLYSSFCFVFGKVDGVGYGWRDEVFGCFGEREGSVRVSLVFEPAIIPVVY